MNVAATSRRLTTLLALSANLVNGTTTPADLQHFPYYPATSDFYGYPVVLQHFPRCLVAGEFYGYPTVLQHFPHCLHR